MLTQLKTAQNKLVHSEKMASLGQLTAGIAHEIKNPLNFVNNFSSLSNEMLDELKETLTPLREQMPQAALDDIDDVMETLAGNLKKIGEHGRRADGIVKSMLMHSRGGSGERRSTDLNALIEEALNLAYHGARAQDQTFNVTMEKDFDAALTKMDVVPQDLTRVFINLFGNGFYATEKRKKDGGDATYRPTLKVSTRVTGDEVEINVRDNGIGMTPQVREKLFTPFFTTKPTGEGTGLGLSITHDIVVQLHGGAINVDSAPNEFTQFTIRLPRSTAALAAQQPAAVGGAT
jgi:signal transduction histidine kinase